MTDAPAKTFEQEAVAKVIALLPSVGVMALAAVVADRLRHPGEREGFIADLRDHMPDLLPAEPARRDYAAGLPPEIEAQIKQATWAFFQSLCETAKASPETFHQMVGNAKRETARNEAKGRDILARRSVPIITDLRKFDWPGKAS